MNLLLKYIFKFSKIIKTMSTIYDIWTQQQIKAWDIDFAEKYLICFINVKMS